MRVLYPSKEQKLKPFTRRADPDRSLTDEELVSQLQQEMDAERFAVLYDRYSTKVFQKCVGMARDRDLAKDLTHDIFLKVFVNLSKFDHKSKFGTWVYSITYNYCLDALRKNQRHQEQDIDERMPESLPLNDESEAALLGLRAERLDQVLSQIDPADRAILLMKYEDELPVADMQAALGVGESAVKMRLLRARERAIAKYRQLYPGEP
ncbi:MAG: RNA polymerase sigma factor [Flavobacteriales bacterium]|nr:RNA polymerase sigma factor [Flavobacteriales bacterium]MBK6755599.1 RNA polymerase sigma factor [Flavobacteriales bacterium]MBK7754548.1 RNA polymerase sigma factor [Flavobacteriales bacterium]MBK9076871.1 RNA polymerase sigma factor [Flavobacteriales bacterium]MBK9538269.1 RNA polymerase sigma factor [Flavobacteriales bacterium]